VGSGAFVWVGAQVQGMLTKWCEKSIDVYSPDDTIFRVSRTFYSNNCTISFQPETRWTEQHNILKPAFNDLEWLCFFASLYVYCAAAAIVLRLVSYKHKFLHPISPTLFLHFFQIIKSFAWMPRIWLELLKMSKYVINDHQWSSHSYVKYSTI
jgi:hypothetical protein